MGNFLKLPTLLGSTAAGIIFIAGFFFFIQTNEPIEVVLEDTPIVPIEVVEAETPTPPILQENTLPLLQQIQEDILEEPRVQETPKETPPTPEPTVEEAPTQSFVSKDLELINTTIQKALVNILCIADPLSPVGSISGSGVIIDPSGTILTNAHIAQELLLKDYPQENTISCTVRTGSPAKDTYTVELAYISPLWVLENKDAIAQKNPTGTGKDDFALLTITGATEFATLPEKFPYLPLTFEDARIGETVISAGYPASFLSSDAIRRNLVQISSAGSIKDIFTFAQTSVDVLSLGGVPLAQQGASGGAVVRADGSLIGLVVTSSLESDTQERDLRAISTGHIARSFMAQHHTSFAQYALGNILPEKEDFAETIAPALTELLLQALGEI